MLVFDPTDGLWFDDGKPSEGAAPSDNPNVSLNNAIYNPLSNQVVERVARKVIGFISWNFNPTIALPSAPAALSTYLMLPIVNPSLNTFGIKINKLKAYIKAESCAFIFPDSFFGAGLQTFEDHLTVGFAITNINPKIKQHYTQDDYDYLVIEEPDILSLGILTVSNGTSFSHETYKERLSAECASDYIEIPPQYGLYFFFCENINKPTDFKMLVKASALYTLLDS